MSRAAQGMRRGVQGTFAMAWRDRLAIEMHVITAAAITISDILAGRPACESDYAQLAKAVRRLRALAENIYGR